MGHRIGKGFELFVRRFKLDGTIAHPLLEKLALHLIPFHKIFRSKFSLGDVLDHAKVSRMLFVFDLDEDLGMELPTTVSRSIEDVPQSTRDKKTATITKTIMSSIATIMTYIRQGSRPMVKKVRKKEKDDGGSGGGKASAHAAAPAKPIPDEDIFDDAGSYDLAMRATQHGADHHRR